MKNKEVERMRNFTRFIKDGKKTRLDIHCFDLEKKEGEELFEILKNLGFDFCYMESDSLLAFLTGEYSRVKSITKRLEKYYGFAWTKDKRIQDPKMLNMRSLLTEKQRHLLWKDECNDDFILLKYGEVYRYSKNRLMISCWSRGKALQLIKRGLILAYDRTDDLLYHLETDLKNLGPLIALGAFKRRPDIRGKWLNKKEELLGHRIRVFKPNLRV